MYSDRAWTRQPPIPRHGPYDWDMPAALGPVLVLLVILAIDMWVYADAKQRADQDAPIVVRIGAFVLETPERGS